MELLERYLQAVKKHLPWQRQDDIIAELRANLEAQLEEREAELGRALNRQEAEDWLKGLGHPMLVAAKYQPVQYLVGPGLFPMYWYVLRLVFLWATVVYAVVCAIVVPLTTHDSTSVITAVLRWPGVLFTAAAWVTLVFAALELVSRLCPGTIPQLDAVTTDWKPSALPPLEPSEKGAKPRSYAKAVAEVVFGFLTLGWLLILLMHPFLLLGPGTYVVDTLPFRLAPVWWQFYWVAVALNVVQLAWTCLNLLTGAWQGRRLAQHLVTKLLGLVPLGLLLAVPNHLLFVLKDPGLNESKYAATLYSANEGTHMGLMVVCAIVVLQLAWEVVQAATTGYRARSAPAR